MKQIVSLLAVIVLCCGYVTAAPATLVRRRRVSGNDNGVDMDENLLDYDYKEGDDTLYDDYEEYDHGTTFSCFEGNEEVPIELICDGVIDCTDGSDEVDSNCEDHGVSPTPTLSSTTSPKIIPGTKSVTSAAVEPSIRDLKDYGYDYEDACTDEEFQCTSDISICLPKSQVCDGVHDCPLKEDEASCADSGRRRHYHATAQFQRRNVTVLNVTADDDFCLSLNAFQCRSRPGDCVPTQLLCDGIRDCPDGSDEERCSCGIGKYLCLNGQCVEAPSRCNGKNDCGDFSDEIIGCVMFSQEEKKDSKKLQFRPTRPVLSQTLLALTESTKTSHSSEENVTNSINLTSVATFTPFTEPERGICSFHPCANGGQCFERSLSFVCVCKLGYTGPTCIQQIDKDGDSSRNASAPSIRCNALLLFILYFCSLCFKSL